MEVVTLCACALMSSLMLSNLVQCRFSDPSLCPRFWMLISDILQLCTVEACYMLTYCKGFMTHFLSNNEGMHKFTSMQKVLKKHHFFNH